MLLCVRGAVCELCASDVASPKTTCDVCASPQSLIGSRRRRLPMCRACLSLWMPGDNCDVCQASSAAVATLQFGDALAARVCDHCLESVVLQLTCCFQCRERKAPSELATVDCGMRTVRLCTLCKWQFDASPKAVRERDGRAFCSACVARVVFASCAR